MLGERVPARGKLVTVEASAPNAAIPLHESSDNDTDHEPSPHLAHTAACTARHLGLEPERFPLLVACGRDGRAAYASAGYEVGAVDLLRRILEFLCGQSTEK